MRYLSGGEKRKLSLAMALIGDAKFIILDEPTSSLDYQSREQVWDLIKKIAKGRSLLIITQDIEEADHLASKICIMKNGERIRFDTPANLKNEYSFRFRLDIYPKSQMYNEQFREDLLGLKQFIKGKIKSCFEVPIQYENKLSIMIPRN